MNTRVTSGGWQVTGRDLTATPTPSPGLGGEGGEQINDGAHGVTRPTKVQGFKARMIRVNLPPNFVGGEGEKVTCHASRVTPRGFTLVEVLLVMVLLSLIVIALMAVFNSTQTAFRASVTQAGVLDDGRAAMDLMANDLRAMSPSDGISNYYVGAANFYAAVTNYGSPPSPLVQPMIGGGSARTNVLENFFILSRGNQNGVPTWFGVGYAVMTNPPPGPLYSLYRFATNHPVAAVDPAFIFTNDFRYFLAGIIPGSHLLDGVVDLTVRPYDINGAWMTTNVITYYYANGQPNVTANLNTFYFPPVNGEVGFCMFSNTLPAAVQLEMGVLEDRALQRAQSLEGSFAAQSNYLAGVAGQVHIFRQRVSIPGIDPSAYP